MTNPRSRSPLLVCFLLTAFAGPAPAEDTIPLAGTWLFALDRQDVGVAEHWFQSKLKQTIQLPGSLQEQGYGDEVSMDTEWIGGIVDRSWFTAPKLEEYRQPGNVKIPFWLQPDKHYVGAAWYQRDVQIPAGWAEKRIILTLERCHWETTVWVNAVEIGTANSLSTPHVYDLTGRLSPGHQTITIRVDNRVKIGVGVNAHSVSDHTQSNWNGLVGELSLRATPAVRIDDIQVHPDVKAKNARVVVKVGNDTNSEIRGALTVHASCGDHRPSPSQTAVVIDRDGGLVEARLPMGADVRLWNEFDPNIYQLTATLETAKGRDSKSVTFGMREFSRDGTQFTVNGHRIFLRGTLECAIFPLTGYPHTDVAGWKRIFQAIKAHGLNHMRFHSWCPPKAAFQAADEMGVYLHVECAAWANQGSSVGDGKPIDQFIYAEGDRILESYGNHPSFCMLAYGNEPAGKNQKEFLGDLVTYWKNKDPRREYTSGAGWPIIPESDFHSTPAPRIHQWGVGTGCRLNALPPETITDYRDFVAGYDVPVVSHEIGQWCVYPNLEEIQKYTGVLKPKNFEIFRDLLKANHMLDQARDFLIASGKLQTLCYKEEIESALRTPGFGGFQLLDLHDFPGQGTALVGVLDPFWEYKGYVTAEEFFRFCCETVPLARMKKRVWTTKEAFEADVELAHFGPSDLENSEPVWTLVDTSGRVVASGRFTCESIAAGRLTPLGHVRVPLDSVSSPAKLFLRVEVTGTRYANSWDIWVYPDDAIPDVPADILIVDQLDDAAVARLAAGGNVLLLPARGSVKGDQRGGIPPAFTPIFWNTAWTRRQPPHTLGILCDPAHPALSQFPTEMHSNWQWWDLVTKSQIMILDSMPPKLRPIVQVIDDWFTARRLALVFEARVARGRLLVCSIDLQSQIGQRPVARQMLQSLVDYMSSDDFRPTHKVSLEEVAGLFRTPSMVQRLGAEVIRVDSQAQGYEGRRAIDGDPRTVWHSAWEPTVLGHPHEIVIDLGQEIEVAGFVYLPRQDMKNGRVDQYEFYASSNDGEWGDATHTGRFSDGKTQQVVRLEQPVTARVIRLVGLSEVGGGPWTSVAELDIIQAD